MVNNALERKCEEVNFHQAASISLYPYKKSRMSNKIQLLGIQRMKLIIFTKLYN